GLGAVLAAVLTGRPPFVADTSETTRVKAAQGDVGECFARLDTCGADPDLGALCRRCLAPRPEGRPRDGGGGGEAGAGPGAGAGGGTSTGCGRPRSASGGGCCWPQAVSSRWCCWRG